MRRFLQKMLSGMMAVVLMSTCTVTSNIVTTKADGEVTCNQNIIAGKNNAVTQMITADTVNIDGTEYNNYIHYNGIRAKGSTELQPASNAIDKKMGSRWESVQGVDNQTLTVDLGNTYAVKGVAASWEAASAKTYNLQISVDGKNYQNITTVTSNMGERAEMLTFSAEVNARYIRFNCLERNTNYAFSIFEVGVFGSEAQKEVLSKLDNLTVQNYYAYSGKYMLYFDEETGATGYNVYIDDAETPVKTIASSGAYLDEKDVKDLAEGTHTVRVVALNSEGNE